MRESPFGVWSICDGCTREMPNLAMTVKERAYLLSLGWAILSDTEGQKHFCAECVAAGRAVTHLEQVGPVTSELLDALEQRARLPRDPRFACIQTKQHT